MNVIPFRRQIDPAEELIRNSPFCDERISPEAMRRAVNVFNEHYNAPGGDPLSALMYACQEIRRIS